MEKYCRYIFLFFLNKSFINSPLPEHLIVALLRGVAVKILVVTLCDTTKELPNVMSVLAEQVLKTFQLSDKDRILSNVVVNIRTSSAVYQIINLVHVTLDDGVVQSRTTERILYVDVEVMVVVANEFEDLLVVRQDRLAEDGLTCSEVVVLLLSEVLSKRQQNLDFVYLVVLDQRLDEIDVVYRVEVCTVHRFEDTVGTVDQISQIAVAHFVVLFSQ